MSQDGREAGEDHARSALKAMEAGDIRKVYLAVDALLDKGKGAEIAAVRAHLGPHRLSSWQAIVDEASETLWTDIEGHTARAVLIGWPVTMMEQAPDPMDEWLATEAAAALNASGALPDDVQADFLPGLYDPYDISALSPVETRRLMSSWEQGLPWSHLLAPVPAGFAIGRPMVLMGALVDPDPRRERSLPITDVEMGDTDWKRLKGSFPVFVASWRPTSLALASKTARAAQEILDAETFAKSTGPNTKAVVSASRAGVTIEIRDKAGKGLRTASWTRHEGAASPASIRRHFD
jgi:hypothetical protein